MKKSKKDTPNKIIFEWDARSLGRNLWLRSNTGEFKNRYFEKEEENKK